jgi:predicted transcriptional regulator
MSTGTSFKGSPNSRTSEVLVTFSAKWREALLSGSIKCVLRRRYPKSLLPTRMYLYIAAPFSQVIGVSSIARLIDVNIAKAQELQDKTHLSLKELTQYFDGYDKVGCYFIESTELFHPPIHLESLRESWSFYAPQSFVSLSREAVQWFSANGTTNSSLALTRCDASMSAGKNI